MNLCSYRHEEVCFEGSKCPLCSEIEDRFQLERELNERISELEKEIDDLQNP